LETIEVGGEKWRAGARTEAAISLNRVKVDEKLLWRACFERYHPRLPTTSPSPRLRLRKPNPKLQSLYILSQERVNLRTANLADTFTGSTWTKAH